MHEAKTHLSGLIEAARRGDEVIILRRRTPLVRLQVLDSARPVREIGGAKGNVVIADDFDAPLDDFSEYKS